MLAGTAGQAAPDLARVEDLVERDTNRLRAEEGQGRLAPEAKLARAAKSLADFMARTDEYGHGADGATPAERTRRAGYDHCLVSENIAYQYTSGEFETADLARRFIEGWKASPEHRKNMLEPDATDFGVAVAKSPRSRRYYAVQVFGRPRSRAVDFRVTSVARRGFRYQVGDKSYELAPRQARSHTVCGALDVTFPTAENGKGRTIRPSGGENIVVRGDVRLTVRAEP